MQGRIATLKKIACEYYSLPDKALIERHTELLRVFDVRGSKHKGKHPHKMWEVCIRRKALKHIVESRRVELGVRHSEEEALASIYLLLDKLQEVITDFDLYTFEPPKHVYTKGYSNPTRPFIRVLVDEVEDRLEIRTIHFSKDKKM